MHGYLDRTDVIDADGHHAQIAFDGFDRRSKWIFPSTTPPSSYNDATQASALSSAGSVDTSDYEAYGYDANGNRTSLRKRGGQTITYGYDALNRTTSKTVPGGHNVSYGYDLLGRQTSALFTDTSQGITNSFDALGRMISSTTTMAGVTRKLSYQYDADYNRTQITHPDGQVFTYGYDLLDRLKTLYEGAGTTAPLDTFVFNSDQTVASRTEGPVATPTATANYTWDGISRLRAQSDAFPSATGSNVSRTFTSNPADEILSEARDNDGYAYGGLLNVNRSYGVNGLNQYTTAGAASFAYDSNGNLTSDGTNTYAYDIENRLVTATAAGVTASLTYDPLGRLFQVAKGTATTQFLYDGNALVAEYDANGNMLDRYVHSSNIAADDPLVWYSGSTLSSKHFFHADHLGSIVASTSCNGANPCINSYDEYGIPGSANTGRFQYTGQAWIPELGMYYYKARMYSPTLGRFMQTDPVGYKDQVNLYEYVGDDPANAADPSGTDSWLISRPVYEFGMHWADHMFIVVADKLGATPKAEFHYGPQYSGAIFEPGKLVSLTKTQTETARTDHEVWSNLSKNKDPLVHVERIPASDPSVISRGKEMDKFLGTPTNPGPVQYSALPARGFEGNSDSAAESVANNAVQAEKPGAPLVNPPVGSAWTPGSTININPSTQCVSSGINATCHM